jgi:hypothetical protein
MSEEEQKLRDAALKYARGPMSQTFGARDELFEAIEQFARSVDKTSSPEHALRCEPKNGGAGGRDQHWLASDITDDFICVTWVSSGTWMFPDGAIISPEAAHNNCWRYHSPAIPDRPSDEEDMAKIGRSLMAAIDANLGHPLLKDWAPAEDPAEIVGDLLWAYDQAKVDIRVPPTDEAIRQLYREHFGECNSMLLNMPSFVRRALCHFTAPARVEPLREITDEQILAEANRACNSRPNTEDGTAYVIFADDLCKFVRFIASEAHPTPVQQEISDSEIWETFCCADPGTMVSRDRIVRFARMLLARAQPPENE